MSNKIDATLLAQNNYRDYSLYVMETRALPSIYDGLKTVQRRILYVADQYPQKLVKTANLEGSVMKYHCHGGASGAICTMAYPDNNIPIFTIKGNWGSKKMSISAAACFTGDVKISLLDGREISFEDLYKESRINHDSEYWVYSSTSEGKVVPKRVIGVYNNGFRPICKITLDNGEEVKCTLDHRFMLRDGSYCKAYDLKEGQSLMPLYRNIDSRGYEMVYHNDSCEFEYTHRLCKYDVGYDKRSKKYVIHHKNFNKRDNCPSNLVAMTFKDHSALHNQHYEKTIGRPEVKRESAQKMLDYMRNHPEVKKQSLLKAVETNLSRNPNHYSDIAKLGGFSMMWKNPEHVANMKEVSRKNIEVAKKYADFPGIKARGFCRNTYGKVLEKFGVVNETTWNLCREKFKEELYSKDPPCPRKLCSFIKYETIFRYYDTLEDLKSDYESRYNHKVVKVEVLDHDEVVYDIEVEDLHNFALSAGVFVHNSRYTELYMSELARFMYTQFIEDAPFIEGEIGHLEPENLPALLPYGLLEGSQGIGVGLSSKIVPLNVMDLIDYYIDTINNGSSNRLVRPEFGASILLMDSHDVKLNVENYKGSFKIQPVIKQESSDTFVITDLYSMSISTLVDKLSKYITTEQVDFIDESTSVPRYVFKVYDTSVCSQFKSDLYKLSTKTVSFNRVMTENGKAVYCSLSYVVAQSLKYLNSILDQRVERLRNQYQSQLNVYLAIEDLKKSKYLKLLPQYSNLKELAQELSDNISSSQYSTDIWKKVLQKPISYLTKSHEKEIDELQSKLESLRLHNRQEFLVDLYTKLKELLNPFYSIRSHTLLESELLTHPKVRLSGTSLVVNGSRKSSKNLEVKSGVYLFTSSGRVIKTAVSAAIAGSYNVDNLLHGETCVGISTDCYKAVELVDNYGKSIVFELSNITASKQLCDLKDFQHIVTINSYLEIPESLLSKVRKRKSKI